jgi:hypothetical protein
MGTIDEAGSVGSIFGGERRGPATVLVERREASDGRREPTGDWRPSAVSWGFGSERAAGCALFGHCLYGYTQPFGMGAQGHFALRQSSWFLDVEMRINPPQPPLSAASRDTRSGRRARRRPLVRRRSSSCPVPSREDWQGICRGWRPPR